MTRVSVVFTEHEERGLTNAEALLAILVRIAPEAIFLECPPSAFDSYLRGTHARLEPAAVGCYRNLHPQVDLVPVDAPTPDAAFFTAFRDLIERVGMMGPDYDRLAGWHRQYVAAHGFAYLNSGYCSDIHSQQHNVILAAIAELGDQQLAECYKSWLTTNSLRDTAMMASIEEHCRHADIGRAAFLVGAGHRQSIIELSARDQGTAPTTVQWDFASVWTEPTQSASA